MLGLCLCLGCGPEEEVRIQLTPAQIDAYQAIAREEIDVLRPRLDSICAATFEARVAAATDSIVQLRLEEELRLRRRLGQSVPQ
ncbi:hypothetical protein LEM8419_02098 [Neolewinella maritima]|uniref:Uncharacterized protein n=1 Tax=Neolewinella maritima TaxID=1383882 RepID=A0ABN8F7J1_9BACT|nr:hypothetical protein LEM8419_02098 [Neolewinella maritima]